MRPIMLHCGIQGRSLMLEVDQTDALGFRLSFMIPRVFYIDGLRNQGLLTEYFLTFIFLSAVHVIWFGFSIF